MKNKTKTQSAETLAPNPTYAPYVNDAANQQQGAYQAAQTNVNQNVMPALQQGMNYYGDELAGKYLDSNPYMDSVLAKTNQDISNGVNSQFEGAGRYGSGNHAGVLADKIAANENSVRYGNYANERGYMNTAAAGLGPLAALSAGMPQSAAGTYGNNISNIVGRYVNGTSNSTTTTQKSPFELWLQAASAAASAAAAGSDIRLKDNVRRLGELDDGLPVYSFTYRQDMGIDLPEGPQVGVMAHEVAEKRPWALGPKIAGEYGSVFYGRL